MVTSVETASDVIDMLNDLIELNHDIIHAYEAAIGRIDNGEHQDQLTAFKDDHDQHIRDLDSVIRKLGGKPTNGASLTQVVTAGKIAIADMMGDKTVLEVMKSNDVDDTNKAYKRAAARRDLPPEAVPVIQAALDDERRHHEWFEKTIAAS